jgi:hypothetical protein
MVGCGTLQLMLGCTRLAFQQLRWCWLVKLGPWTRQQLLAVLDAQHEQCWQHCTSWQPAARSLQEAAKNRGVQFQRQLTH